jgi:hypothetical protein
MTKDLTILNTILPRVVTLIYFAILFAWIFMGEGGLNFEFDGMFGWHALCMSIFILVFMQEAIFGQVAPCACIVRYKTKVHLTLHSLGLISAMLGIASIVKYKQLSGMEGMFPYNTLYSPHSWLALVFFLLLFIQTLLGVLMHCTKWKKPVVEHRFLGVSLYVTGMATCALGFQSMQSSDLGGSMQQLMNLAMDANGTWQDMNVTQDMGYFPNSDLANLASVQVVLLMVIAMSTVFVLVKQDVVADEVVEKPAVEMDKPTHDTVVLA